jgi:hypothetical protein
MATNRRKERRVLFVRWKNDQNRTELFVNLEIFCLSYVRYDYNTLTDKLSGGQVFENDEIVLQWKPLL